MPWETLTTSSGHTYTDWREPLPRIPDVFLNNIVYLYPDLLSADTGDLAGGSGFLIGIPSDTVPTATHFYAVTNRHVITTGNPVVRLNLKHESSRFVKTRSLNFSPGSWVKSDDHDLAVRAFPPDFDPSLFNYSLFGMEQLMSREYFEKNDVGPGDDLFYVGRFRDHAGEYSNMPSVRFGNLSMNPSVDEPLDLGDGMRQVSFLVEARSRSGYSGSPVFFYGLVGTSTPRMALILTIGFSDNFKILGVDCAHINEEVELFHSETRKPLPMKAHVHAGMMAVVPAWYLDEFIRTSPRLIEQRLRDDEHYRTHPPKGSPD